MNTVFIKLYVNPALEEFHDLCIDSYEKQIAQMKQFAESMGQRLFFSAVSADGDVVAEVEYTGELSAEARCRYVAFLQALSQDADIENGQMEARNTLAAVRFLRRDGDVVLL